MAVCVAMTSSAFWDSLLVNVPYALPASLTAFFLGFC